MNLKIQRLNNDNFQTIGRVEVYDDCYETIYECHCLELPDLNNKRRISRIPSGIYKVVKRWSRKYGYHFHIKDVDNRTLILIHSGNTYKHTKGCILVGDNLLDINNDELFDVVNSKNTMKKLLKILPNKFVLQIKDEE